MNVAQSEAFVSGGILGGMLATFGLAIFVIYILLIVAEWKIFTKAGEAGWKSLIPIYNVYILFKIAGVKNWFWYTFIVTALAGILSAFLGDNSQIMNIISIFVGIFEIYVGALTTYKLSTAFGKGIGFTIGLILLPNIFTLILGFGSAEYVGNNK